MDSFRIKDWKAYREHVGLYPAPSFFAERLAVEIGRPVTVRRSLDAALAQLEEIWTVPDRKEFLEQLEAILTWRGYNVSAFGTPRHPVDTYQRFAVSLRKLVDASVGRPRGERHSAEMAVVRLSGHLPRELQLFVVQPWLMEMRYWPNIAVLRCLQRLEDISGLSEVLIARYRHYESFEYLRLVARDAKASAEIDPDAVLPYFEAYRTDFKEYRGRYLDKSSKYCAMIAAKVLIHGNVRFDLALVDEFPEIFCWALTEVGGTKNENRLIEILWRHPHDPELIWSAIRGTKRCFMPMANQLALSFAHALVSRNDPPAEEAAD